jgi:hypothetical protein
MTTQGTSGTWHRDSRTGLREWRISSDWAQEATDADAWTVTRMANRTNRRHEWDWTDYTEMTLETASGESMGVIVDEAGQVTTRGGEFAPDDVAEVAVAFRVEVPRV